MKTQKDINAALSSLFMHYLNVWCTHQLYTLSFNCRFNSHFILSISLCPRWGILFICQWGLLHPQWTCYTHRLQTLHSSTPFEKECICEHDQCGWFYRTVKHKQYCCPVPFNSLSHHTLYYCTVSLRQVRRNLKHESTAFKRGLTAKVVKLDMNVENPSLRWNEHRMATTYSLGFFLDWAWGGSQTTLFWAMKRWLLRLWNLQSLSVIWKLNTRST